LREKKIVQIQMFRPKAEDLKRIPPEKARAMAEDTIIGCRDRILKKAEELKTGKITKAEFKVELRKKVKMIRDAQKTIDESRAKKEDR
jgi:hypothetical protein